MQQNEVIGIGAMNLDRLYRVECILIDGETVVEEQAFTPGGSAANTIYGLTKLGIKSGFVGAVGDDADGHMLIDSFQKAGVDTSEIKVKEEAPTGSALCLIDEEGRRAIYVLPGANNLLGEQDIPLKYLNQAKIVHFSSFVGEEQLALQKNIMSALTPSVTVSFAPGALYATRGISIWENRPTIGSMLQRSNILFVNREEMEQLTGMDYSAGAQGCLDQGCHVVVVTLSEGIKVSKPGGEKRFATCYIRDREQEIFVEPKRAQDGHAVDTTGAGDAFVAGFLFGLLRKKNLEECGLLGDLMARFCISRIGAREGLPSLDELSQSYRQIHQRTV